MDQGPAGFTDTVSHNPLKSVSGYASIVSALSANGTEASIAVPSDLLGESALLAKGERAQSLVEAAVKTMGIDPSGGQGLSQGMNHFPQSQAGNQQAAFSHGQYAGVRVSEERSFEIPTPTLQRLQMDVQVSETNRVHIDVGVQQRQVYAGLVMDHAMLRNLAVQSVPQLENQLAQLDMELEEFSADVREQQEPEAHPSFGEAGKPHPSKPVNALQGETGAHAHSVSQGQEQGLHFVA
jgi:hypothetical protein